MAERTTNTALALVVQAALGAFTAPGVGDRMPISNLRPSIQGVRIANDEYTGGVALNGEQVAGKAFTASFNVKVRGPGGAAPPAANTFLPGLLMQAAKMTEVVSAAAIPVAAEATTAGTTTQVTLGVGAAATADLYFGYPILLPAAGANYAAQMQAISDYTVGKAATLARTLPSAYVGNYQIPKFLGYYRSITSTAPINLSMRMWYGGNRYDLKDVRVTDFQMVVPVSTKQAAAFPEYQVTISATIDATTTEASPVVAPLGAVPFFKGGQQHLSKVAVGGSTFTLNMGITTEDPPNPNQADGTDPSELISTTARLSMNRLAYKMSTFDTLALADAQLYHNFWAQWGSVAGNMVGVIAPKVRMDYSNPELGGNINTETGDLLIDANDKGVGIYFPY